MVSISLTTMSQLRRQSSAALSQSQASSPRSSSDALTKTFPTRNEWESWKEVIRDLYIERNMTLSRLRDHMAQEHGFYAEDHEYKRRLAQWRFRKNYTSAEKEAVALHLDNFRAQRQPTAEPEFLLNDRPLRMDKIERHRKAARRKSQKAVPLQLNSEAGTPSPPAPAALPPQYMPTDRGEPYMAMEEQLRRRMAHPRVPQHTFPVDHSEAMLWNIHPYDQAQRDALMTAPAAAGRQDRAFVLVYNIVRAVHTFAAGNFERATQILDECCGSVEDLLRTETWNFVMYMTVLQTLPAWEQARCRELYCVAYSFFARMSDSVLGFRHPVSNFLHLANDFDGRHEALRAACVLVLELGAQQYDMVQSMTNYSGGIVSNAQGGFDYKLLQSDGMAMSTATLRGQTGKDVLVSLEEMLRLFRREWSSAEAQNPETAAILMSERKTAIEDYVRRFVERMNTAVAPHSSTVLSGGGTSTMHVGHATDTNMGLDDLTAQWGSGGTRITTTSRYRGPAPSIPPMAMRIEDLDQFGRNEGP